MAKTIAVICDGCGADLTSAGNCVDYRLALINENIPTRGGFVTAMGKYPALDDGDKYFCGLNCLDQWRARVKHEDALWREFHESRITDRCENSYSLSHVSKDERAAKRKVIEAAALKMFPMRRSSNRDATEFNEEKE